MSTTKTLAEVKAVVKALQAGNGVQGSKRSNAVIAASLAGTEFLCTAKNGNVVKAVVLPEVSSHGKVQARFGCAHPGCTEEHNREQSDWHQAHFCRQHGPGAKKSTPQASRKTPEQMNPEERAAYLKETQDLIQKLLNMQQATIKKLEEEQELGHS